jgi:EmrB/QacA subfamily drug resistance transporter
MKKLFFLRDTYKWWVLVTVSIGSFMALLDISLLMVSLPRLAGVFKTDSSVIGWVNIAYLITSQSLMLTLARIGDASGRRRVYVIGLALYTVGMMMCAMSQSIGQLITARAIQGIGAATSISLSTAIAVAVFPPRERGKALGILSGISSVGLVAGPMLGGVILDMLGWRALFYARLPVGIVGIVMALLIIKEQKDESTAFQFDLGGAVSLFGCLTSLLLFFTLAGKWGLFSAPVMLLGVSAILLLALFLRVELKAPQPIIDLGLFRNTAFTGATVSNVIQAAAMSAAVFLVPFYLVDGIGYSASMAGALMALIAAPFVLMYPLSGRLSDRMGTRLLPVSGMLVVCVALFFMSRLGSASSGLAIAAGLCFLGAGQGIFQPPNNSAILGSVPKDRLGTASGIMSTTRQIGISSSIAITGSLLAGRIALNSDRLAGQGLDPSLMKRMSVSTSFQDILALAAIFGCLGIITSLVRDKHP